MSDLILGIDLGTTNTVVAACREGRADVLSDEHGLKIQPSVVSYHPNGTVLVGVEAKKRRAIDPRNTLYSIKRLIGRGIHARETREMRERMPFEIFEGQNQQPSIKTRAGDFAAPEISAMVLDHVKRIAETALNQRVNDAVITVPASFTDAQRSATTAAGSIAGLNVVRIINEPTAAAVAFGYQKNLDETIAVYDFGGGTFDISILRVKGDRFEVLSSAGDSFLGGDDIDDCIVQRLVGEFLREHKIDLRDDAMAIQRLQGVAEQVKIDLGVRTRSVIKVDEIAYGDGGKTLNLQSELLRANLEEMAGALVRQTFPVCDEALHMAGVHSRDISALVLVGGTTKMPLVREMASKYFQQEARSDVNPDEAVAVGAALQGEAIRNIMLGGQSGRVTQPGMGAITRPEEGEGSEDATLVEQGETVEETAAGDTEERTLSKEERTLTKEETLTEEQTLTREETHTEEQTLVRGPSAIPPPSPSKAKRSEESTLAQIQTVKRKTPARIIEKVAVPKIPTPRASPPKVPPPVQSRRSERSLFDDQPTRPQPAPPPDLALGNSPAKKPTLTGVAAPIAPGPMIFEVTPQALSIATVGGFCEQVITRNASIPTEAAKVFATSRDDQRTVKLRVCQGNGRKFADNTELGDLILDDLPAGPRGRTKIEVSFRLDVSGRLHVKARDPATGKEQQASLELIGAQSGREVTEAGERLRALRK